MSRVPYKLPVPQSESVHLLLLGEASGTDAHGLISMTGFRIMLEHALHGAEPAAAVQAPERLGLSPVICNAWHRRGFLQGEPWLLAFGADISANECFPHRRNVIHPSTGTPYTQSVAPNLLRTGSIGFARVTYSEPANRRPITLRSPLTTSDPLSPGLENGTG